MALWQINFVVSPKSAMADLPKFNGLYISEYENSEHWEVLALKPDFFEPLNSFLPKTDWYTPSIILFGNEDTNRLEVCIDNNIVDSVSFRIDFRSQYKPILTQLIEFFKANDLIVLDEYLNLMPLDLEAFNIAIQNHKQVKIYNTLANSAT
ncbi:MAG: hypothetical protein M0D57_12320 [Sphingobacteriales bacterium JAD_PAG50586_3]|nr:MAG: hypothetical protein M0D57_12320 [Sphingobacteriales bacterium JAD_PAG50586_3]